MHISKRIIPNRPGKKIIGKPKLPSIKDKAFGLNLLDKKQLALNANAKRIAQGYCVSYAAKNATGLYVWSDDELMWQEPTKENVYLEVVVKDALNGRFIPYLDITATVFNSGKDRPILTTEVPFLWHPSQYHYGKNIRLPASRSYDLMICINELRVARHKEDSGKQRHTHSAIMLFNNVAMPGKNSSRD